MNADRRAQVPQCFRSVCGERFPLDAQVSDQPFRLEADLREPVAAWLLRAGFDVPVEVPILRRRADFLGSNGDALTAIGLKVYDWTQALRQAIAYQIAADRAWIAMPVLVASRAYRQRWHFEAERVGLLAVDAGGRVRAPILAGSSSRLPPFLQEKVLESWRDVDEVCVK